MPPFQLNGLIAATCSPLDGAGRVRTDLVPSMMDRLLNDGVSGVYVCGSTGEGMSLTSAERMTIAEAWIEAAAGRVPVIVQVGHNSLQEACRLAEHAQQSGADVVSATCPSYFRIASVELLSDCMADIAASAPQCPFYYYHIPQLTGSALDMLAFLEHAGRQIPNLAGLKYTAPTIHEFQACRELTERRFDVVWGCDEMLLSARVAGARAAIGSTYNIAAPLYRRLLSAFDEGRLEDARQLQLCSVRMVRAMAQFPFHPALKEVLRAQGIDAGPCRLPLPRLAPADRDQLLSDLTAIGFFDWSR